MSEQTDTLVAPAPARTIEAKAEKPLFKSDSLAFLGMPGRPPVPHPCLPKHLDLAHVTACKPIVQDPNQAKAEITAFVEHLERAAHLVQIIRNVYDARINFSDSVTGVVLGLQHTPYDATPEDIASFFNLGIRILTLCYSGDSSPFGGSFQSPDKSLTERGADILRYCSELGMIVDLSHVGIQTIEDVFRLDDNEDLNLRLIASHSGCTAIYNHPRNLPDAILREIVKRSGVVGIPTITFILDAHDDTPTSWFRHLYHAREICGAGNICIGSDAVYDQLDETSWEQTFDEMKTMLDADGAMRSRWPDTPLIFNDVRRMELMHQYLVRNFDSGTVRMMSTAFPNFLAWALPSN